MAFSTLSGRTDGSRAFFAGSLLVALAIISAVAVMCTTGCAGESQEPVVVGYMGGISGRSSGLGLAGRNGTLLAVEQRNASGGIGGREVRLVVRDDGTGAEASRQGFRSLVKEGAAFVVGPMTSASASEAVVIANELRIPLISPTVTSTDLSGKDDYFFRVCPDNRIGSSSLASAAVNLFELRRVAIVCDDGNASFTRSYADHFQSYFQVLGGVVTTTTGFVSGGRTDYSRLAEGLQRTAPDSVLVNANPVDAAIICQRLRIAGFDGRVLISPWAATSSDFFSRGGGAVEGTLMVDMYGGAGSGEGARDIRAAYRARFQSEPNFASVFAFEATKMALDAMPESGGRVDMKKHLLLLGPWRGYADEFRFDRNGDVVRPFSAKIVRGGRFVPVEQQ